MMKSILGTMTFSDQVDAESSRIMLEKHQASGNQEIDTANQYNKGQTELLLGDLISAEQRSNFFIASKVHPWNEQGLKPDQVKQQIETSLQRLKTDYFDLLYLHSPDLETPIEQTLLACFDAFQKGQFRHFGLSNFAAWQVAEAVEICRSNGWMMPTVYQGMYNALTRDVEKELFSCLRHYEISFYAYNPLAGGLLTGKYLSAEKPPETGRFRESYQYRNRYWKADYQNVLEELATQTTHLNLKPVNIAMSWLIHHSQMDTAQGDAIILGASRIEQLDENLAAMHSPALDASILDILDRGWELIKPNCFKYFRP
ncbi:MAG: aflatoxin B1 aldehyde reductase [Gammaproteobacteria bacterium]|jgi:aflatoxin B1 aldehyde reductase